MARIIPQLSVRDVDEYIAFLRDAFGFEVATDWRDPNDPEHVNIEVSLDVAVVGIGHAKRDRGAPKEPDVPNIGLYVIVDDVDAHHDRARAAGAEISFPIGDQPWATGCTARSIPRVTSGGSRRRSRRAKGGSTDERSRG